MGFWPCTAGGKLYTTDFKESTKNYKFNIYPSDKNLLILNNEKAQKLKRKCLSTKAPKVVPD
jgi:hypothetical protein